MPTTPRRNPFDEVDDGIAAHVQRRVVAVDMITIDGLVLVRDPVGVAYGIPQVRRLVGQAVQHGPVHLPQLIAA